MGFVKVVKSNAYYKRFQVKFRRRRESKTDYYARRRLIQQDKNKYKSPKYRFSVRFTNRDIICQIFSADLTHDVCLGVAYAHELPRYGVKFGLTNWAAAYCTGLLLARRINKKFNLEYEGNTAAVTGEEYHVEAAEEGAAPFKAFLDVGLKRTSTGCKLFGAVKGACDGGLDVPHSTRRFPGSTKNEAGDVESDPEIVKKYVFGGHVSEYMTKLKEEDEETYAARFSRYIKGGVKPADLQKIYAGAHKAIRADPNKARAGTERGYFKVGTKARDPKAPSNKVKFMQIKKNRKQRDQRVNLKLRARGLVSVYEKEAAAIAAGN